MTDTLHSPATRHAVYRRLERRNRLVSVLRWAVPVLGVVVTVALLAQIIIANIAEQYGLSGISFDRESLIIATPRYSGVMANGTTYEVTAEGAVTRLDDASIMELTAARLVTVREDGYEMIAMAQAATLDLDAETITVPGTMTTLDSNGIEGVIENSIVDWPSQTLTASGPSGFAYPDGSTISGQSLVYNSETGRWVFDQAVYTEPGDGGLDIAPASEETGNAEDAE